MSLMKLENPNSSALATVAEDNHTFSLTAVKLLKNDICLGSDANHNLLAMKQQYIEKNKKKDVSPLLSIVGQYHLGDLINKIKEGKHHVDTYYIYICIIILIFHFLVIN